MNKSESLIKSVVYRFFGTVGTFFIALLLTGETSVAGGIAVMEIVFKTTMYYAYERLWEKVGRKNKQ